MRGVLGVGVGIGLAKKRPTKCKPLINCCIGDIITSIEPPCEVPINVATKPLLRTSTNGVDFIYTIENQSLQCNIQYQKIVATSELVAVRRISTALIFGNKQISAYVGAMFYYGEQNDLLVISTIQNGMATCNYSESDMKESPSIVLPLATITL